MSLWDQSIGGYPRNIVGLGPTKFPVQQGLRRVQARPHSCARQRCSVPSVGCEALGRSNAHVSAHQQSAQGWQILGLVYSCEPAVPHALLPHGQDADLAGRHCVPASPPRDGVEESPSSNTASPAAPIDTSGSSSGCSSPPPPAPTVRARVRVRFRVRVRVRLGLGFGEGSELGLEVGFLQSYVFLVRRRMCMTGTKSDIILPQANPL